MERKATNLSVVNFTQQEIPQVIEDTKTRHQYVPVGIIMPDDYFSNLTEAYMNSTTNAACVGGIADMIFGRGIYCENEEQKEAFAKMLSQEDMKRVAFDLKLYGNACFQVYWNDEHTKIIKMYHTPVQNIRAEKLTTTPKIQGYYYSTDWKDQRAVRNKLYIPAFGTSNEKMELLYIKDYSPSHFYYSVPDWFPGIQFTFVEAELSNLHLNNIENGFLPLVMINMNNGIPAPEERDTIEDMLMAKFTGTRNAGKFILSFNDDKDRQPTIDTIQTESLHEKFKYVSEYAQDRILVAHRITSPLLLGIRTAVNGFSSNSEEMQTAYSILQTMTIEPFQNLLLNQINSALMDGGWEDLGLYFEQAIPSALLATQAEKTGQTIGEVKKEIQEVGENPAVTDTEGEGVEGEPGVETDLVPSMSNPNFSKEYEIYKN
jgi:hypothetical protein